MSKYSHTLQSIYQDNCITLYMIEPPVSKVYDTKPTIERPSPKNRELQLNKKCKKKQIEIDTLIICFTTVPP